MRQMFDDNQIKALAKEVINEKFPEAPTINGIYVLSVSVDLEGNPTYSFIPFNAVDLMETVLTNVAGYDATKLQELKNVYSTFSWVESNN